jgi:hypothetical protein
MEAEEEELELAAALLAFILVKVPSRASFLLAFLSFIASPMVWQTCERRLDWWTEQREKRKLGQREKRETALSGPNYRPLCIASRSASGSQALGMIKWDFRIALS